MAGRYGILLRSFKEPYPYRENLNQNAGTNWSDSYFDAEQQLREKGCILGKRLGTGAYAHVKRARCQIPAATIPATSKELLACKMYYKKQLPKTFVSKFLPRELDIHPQLKHVNIIEFVKSIEVGARVFIMMEMADNGDLLDYIRVNGARPDAEARHILREICKGVEYMHELDIAHRDLRCENILMFKSGKVKIAGFALSRRVEEGRRYRSNTFCGTSEVIAPEILQGKEYDAKRADMFAIGCILFVVVCGSMPFDGSDARKMVKTMRQNDVRFPSRIRSSVDEECQELVKNLLEVDVDKRISVQNALDSFWLSTTIAFSYSA